MEREIINSLWVGNKLTPIGVLSVKSFLYYNHKYILWAYEDIPNLPSKAELRDAKEIVPSEVYDRWFGPDANTPKDARRAKIHQNFSDYFRYKLLCKYGGWWCDTDVIALKPFDFDTDYVFAWGKWPCVWMSDELKERLGNDQALNNGVLKCPKESPLLKSLISNAEPDAIQGKFPRWAEWNHPLTGLVCDMGLQKFVAKHPIFEPYGEDDWREPFEEDVTPPDWAYSLHLYNSQGVKDGQPGSLVSKLKSKYTILM